MAFRAKNWRDAPPGWTPGDPVPADATPIDAAALVNVETRLAGYSDQELDAHDADALAHPALRTRLNTLEGAGTAWIVATSDASQRLKDTADYVASGTDDHLTLQAAHDALPAQGGKIVTVGGQFNFAGSAIFTKPTDLDLGDVVIRRTTAHQALRFEGSTGVSTNLSADVTEGATVATVASTTSLAAGDAINLKSDEAAPGATNPDGRKGEINYIKSVDSATQITLRWPAADTYTTLTTGRIVKINFLEGVKRRGGTVTQDGPLTTQGVSQVKYKWCRRPIDEGCAARNNEQTAIEFENCLAWRCIDPDFEDFTVDYAAGYYGYGVIDRGCSRFGRARGISAIRTGAAFGNGSGADGIPLYGGASRGVAVETRAGTASWSSHAECKGTTFADCESYDAAEIGFQLRGRGDRVRRPVVRRAATIGVYARDISRDCRVYDPDVDDCGSHGIAVGGPTAEETNALVDRGLVKNTVGHGVNVNVVGKSQIKGTVVRNPDRDAAFKVGFRNVAGDSIYDACHIRDAPGGSSNAFYRDAGSPQFWDPAGTDVGGKLVDDGSWPYVRGEPRWPSQLVIPSAATITPRGRWCAVTGTTNITDILPTYPGHIVTMKFSDVLTVSDMWRVLLAGNFVTAAGATLTIGCDGATWYEISRSTN